MWQWSSILFRPISRLRDDELEHHDKGLEHNALQVSRSSLSLSHIIVQAPFFSAMKFAIQTGCKGAIWISERI